MEYSIVVPVYNRPDEVGELLASLQRQTLKDFEVIIVDDGSATPCKDVCDRYAGILDIHYYYKENSGPGQSRNYGAERAHGRWLIILDSDVVLPDGYMQAVDRSITQQTHPQPLPIGRGAVTPESPDHPSELSTPLPQREGQGVGLFAAWGGPDTAHPDFTPVQKAISYSMTSFFTTGGIRGGKAKLDKFFPRSFNMGVRSDVYRELGGFSKMRFGEDIDFSYRIVEAGYQTRLLPAAWVWHKRRTDFRKFFRQVFNSGIARINLSKRHPGTLKLVHLLPAVFTLGVIALILASAVGRALMYYCGNDQWRWLCLLPWLPIVAYSLLIFVHSSLKNRSLWVGLLSIPAAFVQLMGYGLGFLGAWWKRCVLGKDEYAAFEKNFYS